jgi:hypothetical protein
VIQSIYACSKHSQYKKNNENLQGLYIKAINHLLDKITNSYQKHTEETSEKVEKVYKLLSLYLSTIFWLYRDSQVLLVEEAGVPQENRRSAASHLQSLIT